MNYRAYGFVFVFLFFCCFVVVFSPPFSFLFSTQWYVLFIRKLNFCMYLRIIHGYMVCTMQNRLLQPSLLFEAFWLTPFLQIRFYNYVLIA